jgi:hypothetical protein
VGSKVIYENVFADQIIQTHVPESPVSGSGFTPAHSAFDGFRIGLRQEGTCGAASHDFPGTGK